MKQLNWKIDFSFIEKEEDRPKDCKVNFANFLTQALTLRFKDGITMESQRKLHKILDKLDSVGDSPLELEDAEFELIDDAFKNAKFPCHFNKVLIQIYDFLDEVKFKK